MRLSESPDDLSLGSIEAEEAFNLKAKIFDATDQNLTLSYSGLSDRTSDHNPKHSD